MQLQCFPDFQTSRSTADTHPDHPSPRWLAPVRRHTRSPPCRWAADSTATSHPSFILSYIHPCDASSLAHLPDRPHRRLPTQIMNICARISLAARHKHLDFPFSDRILVLLQQNPEQRAPRLRVRQRNVQTLHEPTTRRLVQILRPIRRPDDQNRGFFRR